MTAPLRLCVRRTDRPLPTGVAVEIKLRIPSDVSVIEEAVELLARHCFAGWDVPQRAHFRVRVALTEALANAILYGNAEAPASMVDVRVECLPEALHLHVTDEGPGFDPATVRDPVMPDDLEQPRGRGLFLIRNLMDDVRFNPPGNSICMTLRRT
ncbi:MAG TPA: ATP-binding protein [Gemmatimonadales bacterium]|nr:ATP-binding protein [Gemmatimonadales bacterium]